MIRDMVREFAAGELEPYAAEVDVSRRLVPGILDKLGALNLLGLCAPAESGGAGVDVATYALALEELARACASTAVVVLAHNSLGVQPLQAFGTDEQRRRWLQPLASGEKLAAFALSEPEAGSDMSALRTTAHKTADGWVLRGSKTLVVNAPSAEILLVAARTDPDAAPERGIDVFVLEKGAAGLSVGEPADTLGWRGAGIGALVLDDVPVQDGARLGPAGAGLELCERMLDGTRLGMAAVAVGIAQGAFDRAMRYAHDRPQFGKPIMSHQSVQSRLADSTIDLHAARLVVQAGCRLADSGAPYRKEAAIAKVLASEAASRVCDHAIQVHGGYGYIVEYHVERSYRDAKLCEIAYGTNELLRLLIVQELAREAEAGSAG